MNTADPRTQAELASAPRIVTTGSDGRRFEHRDIRELAARLVPPRRVPLGKRLFWSVLLLVLRTERGRHWVQRRYGG